MSSENEGCEICKSAKFRYTCPRCQIRYCSVACYKSTSHLKCSEEFYKSCIQDELSAGEPKSKDEMKKIYEILKRIHETDAGVNTDFADALDSDDEEPVREESDEEEEELATRLQGVDLNDPEAVWHCLSEAERIQFQKMIDCGDIMKLIPDFQPWWARLKESKIVVLDSKTEDTKNGLPILVENIPKFSDICKKQPSPCVHYNLWNIIAAYSCVVRFLGGEHMLSPNEAIAHLVNLSTTLKYGTNFEDVEDAILSVENEALTTGNGAAVISSLYVESREQLKEDARKIMSTSHSKLLALSDIIEMFRLAKGRNKDIKAELNDFQKVFAISNASVELNRNKIKQFCKKIEFFLAYVNRERGNV